MTDHDFSMNAGINTGGQLFFWNAEIRVKDMRIAYEKESFIPPRSLILLIMALAILLGVGLFSLAPDLQNHLEVPILVPAVLGAAIYVGHLLPLKGTFKIGKVGLLPKNREVYIVQPSPRWADWAKPKGRWELKFHSVTDYERFVGNVVGDDKDLIDNAKYLTAEELPPRIRSTL